MHVTGRDYPCVVTRHHPRDKTYYQRVLAELPGEYKRVLERDFFSPPPVFTPDELETLRGFVTASGMRPEGGGGHKFDLSGRKYLEALYAERRDDPFRRLVIMKAAQMGLTVKLLYRAAWLTSDTHHRLNTALMFPTQEAVIDLQKSRYRPMLHGSNRMMDLTRGQVDAASLIRVGVSTMRFRGMRSGIAVDSFPADALLFDEVRLMDLATVERTFVRVSESGITDPDTGARGLIELNSTAGFPNMDIDRWFQRSTMRYWRTPCPNPGCKNHRWGIIMPMRWPDIVGHDKDGGLYYHCPDCHARMSDEHILTQGFYLAEQPDADWEGYHFSQILKGNTFLPDLWSAYTRGDNLSEFYNSRLGLPFQDPDAVPATRDAIDACIDQSGRLRWPEPDEVAGDWVVAGVDQRAPEKHVIIARVGAGGTWEPIYATVLEASGQEAIERTAALLKRWHVKLAVLDGEPSYDYAVGVARLMPSGVVWLADYADGRAQPIEFVDERSKKGIRKVSGEAKYERRVLLDRYYAIDLAMTAFQRQRVRLPSDFYALTQTRTIGGVPQKHEVARELVLHWENIARATVPQMVTLPTGERVMTEKVRRIYRNLALDPHFAHAWTYTVAGLLRHGGRDGLWATPEGADPQPRDATLQGQLGDLAPAKLEQQAQRDAESRARARVCGNCRFFRSLHGDEGLCAAPANATMRLKVSVDTPECRHFRRKA